MNVIYLFLGGPCDETLDFEDARQRSCFVVPSGFRGNIVRSTNFAKDGTYSLKFESDPIGPSRFRYQRPSSAPIQRHDLWRGGIKIWIYKERTAPRQQMEVRLTDSTRASTLVGSFMVDMDFKGWRGIWVSYDECKATLASLSGRARITTVDFVLNHHDTIYIDLLDFVPNLAFQTRDKIVPPFTRFGPKYTYRDFWQRSYHWSQMAPTTLPASIDASMTSSIAHIESRLRNWYCDETTTTYDLTGDIQERWKTLKRSFDSAHGEFDRLNLKTAPPPLFCLRCTRGSRAYSSTDPTRKFSFVMSRVLLPLAIELHLRSRSNEIARTVTEETPHLNSRRRRVVEKSIKRICGSNTARQNEFERNIKARGKPYTAAKVRNSLDYINQERLQRILDVLDYLEDQGWAEGSAIGSLYMELLRSGAGFSHSLYLLKDTLKKTPATKSRLLNLIATAKWHNDFGEVYQSSFEYKGTTADFMITRMIFRLLIVLAMPSTTIDEQKERQRDMVALHRWMENALIINKAFGGVVKPDYTGFHHMAFYASAYVPDALHSAGQVQYLLEGTDFALSSASKRNIKEGLKNLRIIAVKYSTPSSVGGRFPDYSNEVLSSDLPAYAYISVSHRGPLATTPAKGIVIPHLTGDVEMFKRLYSSSDPIVSKNLRNGRVHTGKSYVNSLGSLQIMSTVS